MLQIKSGSSTTENINRAVEQLSQTIDLNAANLIFFFSSANYDLKQVGDLLKVKFPKAEVCGCISAAEISNQGFTEGGISATCIAADDFKIATCVMKEVKTQSAFARETLQAASAKLGLNRESKDGVIIALIDSQSKAEERVLFTVNQCFPNLKLVGGSTADGNPVSLYANGEVYQNAAIITIIKTAKKIFTYKEIMFTPTDIELTATKVDILSRTLIQLNDKPAVEEYARALGLTTQSLVQNAETVFFSHPFGRVFGKDISIASPLGIVDQTSIKLAALILSGAKVRLLNPEDALAKTRQTVSTILENVPRIKGMILFNCILRYNLFKKENICNSVINEYAKTGAFGGFVTYGEQFNRFHVNQTLTLVAFGD